MATQGRYVMPKRRQLKPQSAIACLGVLPDTPYKHALLALAKLSVERGVRSGNIIRVTAGVTSLHAVTKTKTG